MTVGIAASVPLLAPAIALVGAGLVGAPYVILNQSAKMWQETTRNLTDAFWAQAPNDVFVECIEHWSDIGAESDDVVTSTPSKKGTENVPPVEPAVEPSASATETEGQTETEKETVQEETAPATDAPEKKERFVSV